MNSRELVYQAQSLLIRNWNPDKRCLGKDFTGLGWLSLALAALLVLPPAFAALPGTVSARNLGARRVIAPLAPAGFTWVVNTTGDGEGGGPPSVGCDVDPLTPGQQCTLRRALHLTNNVAGEDTITFNIPMTQPNCDAATGRCTINLTQALPDITDSVEITGPGADNLTVQRNSQDTFRIFTILNFTVGPVTISGLTISNGASLPTLTDNDINGGGVLNRINNRLNIINCTLSGNVADGKGGAIANQSGTVNITGSTLTGNSSVGVGVDDGGGAISNFASPNLGTVNVTNSTISCNNAGNFGAGIANQGTLVITNSNISDNSFLSTPMAWNRGGGIYSRFGRVTIINSTLSGNSAGSGGGIWTVSPNSPLNVINSTLFANSSRADGGGAIHNTGVNGTTNITNSTISGNSSGTNGGGIFNFNSSIVNVKSSIIANNTATTSDPDVSGAFQSQNFNLIGKTDGSTGFTQPADLTGTVAAPLDPKLDPLGLQDNGGPTQTIALLAGSPAIDKGTAAGLTGALTTDQRGAGFPRTLDEPSVPNADDGTDTGAFELQPPITAGISSLINESCPPSNGAIDPGETATVNLTLMNTGTGSTTNLVATLLPTANVLAPSGPENYGAIPVGGTASRDFTFTANGTCGQRITLTLQLQDGPTNLGTVTFTFQLGTTVVTTSVFSENFDGVIAPALPAGWTTTFSGVLGAPWTTSTVTPFSAPNDAFANDPNNIADDQLISPVIAVPTGGGQLTFKNNFNLESGFDGEVLEISINGGAFADITAGGNAFLTGGYNGTISTAFGSPIAGRAAWTASSGGYIDSTINLPAAANGQNIQLKWRMGSDNSVAGVGVRIDNIVISNTTFVCNTACAGAPRISTSSVLSCSDGNTVATITLCNSGTATANNVVLTTAKLGGVGGTPLPQSVGTLAPGACATVTVTFSGAPSGPTTLQVGGTYTGGSFNSNRRVTAPFCPPPCAPGAPGCGWEDGDMVTYN